MSALMREHDWSTSAIGAPEHWPQTLRSALGLMLPNKIVMFVAWGPELTFLYNDAYIPVFGKKHPWALGRPFREIWPEAWDEVQPLVNAALAGEATWSENLHLVLDRNGYPEDTWFTFSYSPLRNDDGEVCGMFCAASETTKMVLTERRLEEQATRHNKLFEKAPGFIAVLTGSDHVFEFVNDAYVKMTGGRNSLGRSVRQVFPEIESQGLHDVLDNVYATGERFVAERLAVTFQDAPDQPEREVVLDFIYEPIRDEAGEVSGIFVEGHDVTESHHMQEALRESEERFKQFSDASTNVLWIRDAATMRMVFASPAFDKMYGLSNVTEDGNSELSDWVPLIEPENREAVVENFYRVRAGARVDQEFQIKRATDGNLRWIHDATFPLRDRNGHVQYIAGVGADITDVKEGTDRQSILVSELQHRTRNLITVISALADRTLGNASSLDDFGTRFNLRLSALSRVQGMLSHLAAGERITFKEVLHSELDVYGATNGLAHKFTLEGPDDVPLGSGTVQTIALALHELATNAVKYGALAAANGHLSVRWRIAAPVVSNPRRLQVEWRESGVDMPAVGSPAQGGGYGRELIERALPYQLKAKTTYELGPDGVHCTIDVPMSRTAITGGSGDE